MDGLESITHHQSFGFEEIAPQYHHEQKQELIDQQNHYASDISASIDVIPVYRCKGSMVKSSGEGLPGRTAVDLITFLDAASAATTAKRP